MSSNDPVLNSKPLTMIMIDPKEKVFNISSAYNSKEREAQNNSKESIPTV